MCSESVGIVWVKLVMCGTVGKSMGKIGIYVGKIGNLY